MVQYSCLENPRDGGSWWAAVYGVAQSRAQLKWYSSSSSSKEIISSSAPDNFSTMDNAPPTPNFPVCKGKHKITNSQGPSEEKLCVCVCVVRAPARTCTRIISSCKTEKANRLFSDILQKDQQGVVN